MNASETFGRHLLARRRKDQGAFKVGLAIPLSGTMGLLAPCAYACARLARDHWNELGGVGGRPVELTVLDASELAADRDRELGGMIDQGEIDALITLSNTAVCRSIAARVDGRVPIIYTPLFEGDGLPAWVHAIGETPERHLLPAIQWLADRHRLSRWYLLGNDYSWPRRSHQLAVPGIRASGGQVVGQRYVPLGERDFGAVIEDIVRTRADIVLISLLAGDSVHMCRAFGKAGLASKVLRLSTCLEENAVLGIGAEHTEGLFIAAGYFATLDSDRHGAFKERYRTRFGDRAPALNASSQSVYEGMVHLQHQAQAAQGRARTACLPGVRDRTRRPSDASRDPIYLGAVEGLSIRIIRTLADAPR